MKSLFVFPLVALVAISARADLALATSSNCMSCHAAQQKLLGPSFKDVAAKYKDEKEAIGKVSASIIKGSIGAWGAVPMPPNPQVSEADAQKLATWVLSTK